MMTPHRHAGRHSAAGGILPESGGIACFYEEG